MWVCGVSVGECGCVVGCVVWVCGLCVGVSVWVVCGVGVGVWGERIHGGLAHN